MRHLLPIFVLASVCGVAQAGDPYEVEYDAAGDATIRRTDPGADGAVRASQSIPDLLSVTLSRWMLNTTVSGMPFVGTATGSSSHLFRLDIEFAGLVNPPGPIGDPFLTNAPFAYGPSPLYGFVEINIDRRQSGGRDTGGDVTAEAMNRYLANVGRFGGIPGDSLGLRTVTRPGQVDFDFQTAPHFERSGAEFVFKLCGCDDFSILWTSTPDDTEFSSGDVWVIRGHFFERTSGFRGVSRMVCPTPQAYSPIVNVRFAHNATTNTTQVSMVYALTQEGARDLAGLNYVPAINDQVGCDGNDGSITEAMYDVSAGAAAANASGWNGVDLPTRTMSQGWIGRLGAMPQYLDPTDWRISAIFGTTYDRSVTAPADDGATFVWTDALGCERGDQDGDGLITGFDRTAISNYIEQADGGPTDADGIINGRVTTPIFGSEFDVSDLNYDGQVDCFDLGQFGVAACCRADFNGDAVISLQDLFDFLFSWFNRSADINRDGATTLQDLFDYLASYLNGC